MIGVNFAFVLWVFNSIEKCDNHSLDPIHAKVDIKIYSDAQVKYILTSLVNLKFNCRYGQRKVTPIQKLAKCVYCNLTFLCIKFSLQYERLLYPSGMLLTLRNPYPFIEP